MYRFTLQAIDANIVAGSFLSIMMLTAKLMLEHALIASN
jgi:hypothetical protein